MPKLLDRGVLTDDPWCVIEDLETLSKTPPDQSILVPLDIWEDQQSSLSGHTGPVGLWLDVDTEAEGLPGTINDLPLIAVRFPAFNDGRGLSLAVLLRTRLGFDGELRAIGAVHEDIVHFMNRCGFDSYSLADHRNFETALHAIDDPLEHYQGSVRDPEPAFRRTQRAQSA